MDRLERDGAEAELGELAAGRGDLLAEVAGVLQAPVKGASLTIVVSSASRRPPWRYRAKAVVAT